MKKRDILSTAILSIFLLTLVCLSGSPAWSGERGPHADAEGFRGSMGEEDPHRKFREGAGGRKRNHSVFSAQGMKKALHLDKAQAKEMRALLQAYRKGVILKGANLKIARIELEEAVSDSQFILSEIAQKVKEKEAAATELTMVRVHALAKAKDFLSEDQFEKFMGLIAHRMKGRHQGKSGKHGRFNKGSRHGRRDRHRFGGSHGFDGAGDEDYE